MPSTFLIAPVRGYQPTYFRGIVADLESRGWNVYWPARDTDQIDPVGLNICEAHRTAIEEADCVHFIWDGASQGCLFDLGMAFALRKTVHVISVPARSVGKSFQNVALALDQSTTEPVASLP